MYLEDKIASMRKRVQVKIERARRGAEAFSIVFSGSEPQRVMRVANTLASYFMDENLKVREAQAVGTSEFLDSELEKTRKKLEDREKQLAEYKKQYFGGLPDELETNLRTLDRLQLQLSSRREFLREAKNSLNILETQLTEYKEIVSQRLNDQATLLETKKPELEKSENEQKLELAQKEYDTLLLKYTGKHPDVAKLVKIIKKLKKTIKKEQAGQNNSVRNAIDTKTSVNGTRDSNLINQNIQIQQVKNDIQKIQSDIIKIEQQMKIYQKRVEDTPKRELELQSLQRDYSNIQDVFNSLLGRKLEAELSVTMEKKQKGEQFRILDHARLPEKPISPNVKMLFLLSIATGLGVGAGIIFLLELFDTSIRSEEQIEQNFGLTTLAMIPPMKVPYHKMKKKIEITAFICFSLYAAAFLSFFAILNHKGLDRTINFIKSTLNI